MQVRLKHDLLIVTGESQEECDALAAWSVARAGHVFALRLQDRQTFRLNDLGPREDACNEPINVTSRSPDPAIRLISNFAHTPFELDGSRYESVEAFWQGLKYPDQGRRNIIAALHGSAARRAGEEALPTESVDYRGETVRYGTADHWRLMAAACWAKFSQHEAARLALLGTGLRPLEHRMRRDSRSIPGVVMADIWMKVRRGLIKETRPQAS